MTVEDMNFIQFRLCEFLPDVLKGEAERWRTADNVEKSLHPSRERKPQPKLVLKDLVNRWNGRYSERGISVKDISIAGTYLIEQGAPIEGNFVTGYWWDLQATKRRVAV